MSKAGRRNTLTAKLTPSDIQKIRWRYDHGETQGALAKDFLVSVVQIGRIVRREVWMSVQDIVTDEDLRKSAERLAEVQRTTNDDPAGAAAQAALQGFPEVTTETAEPPRDTAALDQFAARYQPPSQETLQQLAAEQEAKRDAALQAKLAEESAKLKHADNMVDELKGEKK